MNASGEVETYYMGAALAAFKEATQREYLDVNSTVEAFSALIYLYSSPVDLLVLLMVLAYALEVPKSIGVSNATITALTHQATAVGNGPSNQKVATGLKSDENVKIKTEAQVTGAVSSMFSGLFDPEHRRSFASMRRIKDLQGFMTTILKTTGYQVEAGPGRPFRSQLPDMGDPQVTMGLYTNMV